MLTVANFLTLAVAIFVLLRLHDCVPFGDINVPVFSATSSALLFLGGLFLPLSLTLGSQFLCVAEKTLAFCPLGAACSN